MGVSCLHRSLRSAGFAISEDTLGRLLVDLHDEAGDPRLSKAAMKATKARRFPQKRFAI
jgi:hypothetical protein